MELMRKLGGKVPVFNEPAGSKAEFDNVALDKLEDMRADDEFWNARDMKAAPEPDQSIAFLCHS